VEAFVVFALIGCIAGTLGGLLGIGGGLVVVPALTWYLAQDPSLAGRAIHLAVGTSLAVIVFTAMSSLVAHHLRGAVRWDLLRSMTPGAVVGAAWGAMAADALDEASLRRLFGLFELMVATRMLLAWRPRPGRSVPGAKALTGVALIVGTVSATLGIGGGTLTVPFLTWCNVPIRAAVATAAGVGLPIAVSGALTLVWAGRNPSDPNPLSFGFVHLPALVGIAITSVLFAPAGAWLAHHIPQRGLRRVFAFVLAWIGLTMVLG
jgi:uncharacterized membrane protein YfcA